jgi:membrane protease YdiL (CAAX protease family)
MDHQPPVEPKWHFKLIHCFGLIVLLAILQTWVYLIIQKTSGLDLDQMRWFHFAVLNGVPGLITAAAGAYLNGFSLRNLLLDHLPDGTQIVLAGLAILGIAILSSEFNNLLQWIKPLPTGYDLLGRLMKEDLIGVFITVSLIAPIVEEWIFRGVILEGLRGRYSVKTAVITSSILFGLVHVDPWVAINAAMLGIFLCWMKLRTESLMLCVISHALFNSLPFILIRIFNIEISGFTSIPQDQVVFQPLWFDLLGAALLITGIIGIIRVSQAENEIHSEELPVEHNA